MTNLKENQKEIWKPIRDYEGLYEVSSLGRVKSLSRLKKHYTGIKYKTKESIMAYKSKEGNYVRVVLSKNNIKNSFLIHRIVATHFIENKDNKPYINHKNVIKDDNRVENIEWCTQKENSIHALKNDLFVNSNLNFKKATQIRCIFKKHKIGIEKIIRIFKISKDQLYGIINNKNWCECNGFVNNEESVNYSVVCDNKKAEKIRMFYKTKKYTQRELGKIFNMCHTYINKIIRKKRF